MTDISSGPLADPFDELAARADAGQKLGMQALEFVMALANRQGTRLDLEGAAHALENNPVVDGMAVEDARIERRSRMIVAEILRRFADAQPLR